MTDPVAAAQQTAEQTAANIKAEVDRQVALVRARDSAIRAQVATAKLPAEFADSLIAQDGMTMEKASAAIINKWAEQTTQRDATEQANAVRVDVIADEAEKWRQGASNWLYHKAGTAPMVEKHAGAKLDPGEFRGLGLVDLARSSLERMGVRTAGMDKMKMVGMALTARNATHQGGSDFPYILENVLHKTLLAAYATTPDTWSAFCKVGSVSDFRAHYRYRPGTFGTLGTVTEHGEFLNKAIPDATRESITAVTKGNIIALSRQAIINDDMGAFNDLATRFGRAARLSIEVDVYDLIKLNSGTGPAMSDTVVLWHSSHANVSTGAALSAAAIDLDRVQMASQTDPSGNEILDLRPSILVLPISLGSTARSINDAQYDPDTANKLQKPNTVRGLFSKIIDTPRLTGTKRYLFADPAIAPTIEVAFLDGQQEPFLDSMVGWRVDGTEWKVRLDYAVAAVDWRGSVYNAGA